MLSTDDPLVAIDVSKGKSHAQGFLSRGHPCGKPFSFAHTKAGFAKLGKLVSDLLGKAGKPPDEHTGVYSRVVAGWAESSKLGSIPIPPLLSAKARYRREIDLCWPCLDQFIDPTSPAAIAAVTHYRHPSAVLRAGAKRVESVLSKARRRFGRSSPPRRSPSRSAPTPGNPCRRSRRIRRR